MKKRRNLPLVLPFLVLSLIFNLFFLFKEVGPASLFQATQNKEELKGRVVRVLDGDTFDLEEGVRVRLIGVDAPEYPKGCLSLKAKERLEELVLGKEVEIEVVEKDNFGRKLGFVMIGGLLINQTMIEEGLARAGAGENPKYGAKLLAAEDSAKKAKRGIWSSLCAGKEDCLIKGNVRRDRGTKIYQLPECYNYEKVVVNEEEGDLWFCSEEEARKAGFRKSEDCP